MYYSTNNFNRFHSITKILLVIALCAAALLFASCSPAQVPVTGSGPAKPAVAGSVFSGGPAQSQPADAEYRLVTNAQGVRIAAPDRAVSQGDKIYSLSEGYRLVIGASGGEIIPPASAPTTDRQVNLNSGDVLVINGGYGRVNLSDAPLKPAPQEPNMRKEGLGGGFLLVTGADGAFIMQAASK